MLTFAPPSVETFNSKEGDRDTVPTVDYLQDAREHPEESLFFLYKLVKIIDEEFDGERQAIKALRVRKDLKRVKKLANEPARDQRHAPKRGDTLKKTEMADQRRATESATRILRAYENYVRQRTP